MESINSNFNSAMYFGFWIPDKRFRVWQFSGLEWHHHTRHPEERSSQRRRVSFSSFHEFLGHSRESGNPDSLEVWSGSPINTFGDDICVDFGYDIFVDFGDDGWQTFRDDKLPHGSPIDTLGDDPSLPSRRSIFQATEGSIAPHRLPEGAYLYFATEGTPHLKFVKHKYE